jgi:SagB-type dehydrogenase family enzyme
MAPNTDTAWTYHDLTKHSYESIRSDRHFLDWPNFPNPFKVYEGVESVPLPRETPKTGVPALRAISSDTTRPQSRTEVDLGALASILYYSAAVTRQKNYPGGTIYFRAAACAGALYPVEVYVISIDVRGLPAGVYHFNPLDQALDRLREGDFSRELSNACADSTDGASVVLAFSAITWRSAWKYRDRSYRYHFWDNGTVLANALAVAAANRVSAEVIMGFVDAEVGRLIDIDLRRELPLSLLSLGSGCAKGETTSPESPRNLSQLNYKTAALSYSEVEYPSILNMDRSSRLTDREEVALWRERASERRPLEDTASQGPGADAIEFPEAYESLAADESIESVILRRASTRRFAKKPITMQQLRTVLETSTGGFPSDFVPLQDQLNDIYLIVSRVAGVAPGAYVYNRALRSLELLKAGDFSQRAAYLALEQDLGGDGAVTLFFMADLTDLLGRLGNRGYRAVHLEAGIIGGKQYLAAYALGLGATGLTFYDDDVTDFFSPHGKGKSCIFVMAIGVPGKKPLV